MSRKNYSAGIVSHSFWLSEFRKVIQRLNRGKTLPEIKTLNKEENIFSAPTPKRGNEIFNTVSRRIQALPPAFYTLFEESDLLNQKLIVLAAIMEYDSLFFDFVYEVYREKLLMGIEELADSDFRIFFKDKQMQSEKVAGWTDYTLDNLKAAYKGILVEAGLLSQGTGSRKILKPIMDPSLENQLKENGMEMTLHALTGVR